MLTSNVAPPTDSLYKFQAIGGMVLMVASLYVSYLVAADMEERKYRNGREYILSLSAEKIPQIKKLDEEFSKAQTSNVYALQFLCLSLMFLGFLQTRKGFLSWYEKAQVFNDEILRMQCEKLAEEVKQAKKAKE